MTMHMAHLQLATVLPSVDSRSIWGPGELWFYARIVLLLLIWGQLMCEIVARGWIALAMEHADEEGV